MKKSIIVLSAAALLTAAVVPLTGFADSKLRGVGDSYVLSGKLIIQPDSYVPGPSSNSLQGSTQSFNTNGNAIKAATIFTWNFNTAETAGVTLFLENGYKPENAGQCTYKITAKKDTDGTHYTLTITASSSQYAVCLVDGKTKVEFNDLVNPSYQPTFEMKIK